MIETPNSERVPRDRNDMRGLLSMQIFHGTVFWVFLTTLFAFGPKVAAEDSAEVPDAVGIYGHWEAFCISPCNEKKSLEGMIVQNNKGCIRAYWQANPSDHFAYVFFAAGRQVGNRLILFRDGPSGRFMDHLGQIDVSRTAPCKIIFNLKGNAISYDDEESDECGGREGRYLSEFSARLLTRSTSIPENTTVPKRFDRIMSETEQGYCTN